jgi:hypothetical protein
MLRAIWRMLLLGVVASSAQPKCSYTVGKEKYHLQAISTFPPATLLPETALSFPSLMAKEPAFHHHLPRLHLSASHQSISWTVEPPRCKAFNSRKKSTFFTFPRGNSRESFTGHTHLAGKFAKTGPWDGCWQASDKDTGSSNAELAKNRTHNEDMPDRSDAGDHMAGTFLLTTK